MYVDELPVLEASASFCFACNQDAPCFNACCADLDLLLSPYDVLRLRRRLELSSRAFFSRCADLVIQPDTGFPAAQLRMLDGEGRPCPFVRPEGCHVYSDRPAACRIYPLGRGAGWDARGQTVEQFVVVREPHCQGFAAATEWTAAAWVEDQSLAPYQKVDDHHAALVARWSDRGTPLSDEQRRLVALALYQTDEFLARMQSSGMVDRLGLSQQQRRDVEDSDAGLLRFAITWLGRALLAKDPPASR
jgi:Fe-S-cluster containining protein